MSGSSPIQPSHITPFATEFIVNKTHHIRNTSLTTKSVLSTVNNSSSSSSGSIDMLFTWVFIACVALAVLMIVSIFMVILYWKVKRRRRLDHMHIL